MSAWKRQAVPLVFLEIGMRAVVESNGHLADIRRIQSRIDKWLHECWAPLREKGRIDDSQAQRVTAKAATAIQANLAKPSASLRVTSRASDQPGLSALAGNMKSGCGLSRPRWSGRSEMDQCKHCIVRGDVAACEQTDCDKHEYWYTQTLRARVAMLEEALQKIADGRGMVPDKSTIYMNGSVPEVPKHFNVYDMREIARRALEEK